MSMIAEKISINPEDLSSKVEKETYNDILTLETEEFYLKYIEARAKVKNIDKLTALASALIIMIFFTGLYGLYEELELSFITSFDLSFLVSVVLFVLLYRSYSNSVKTLKVYEYVFFLLNQNIDNN